MFDVFKTMLGETGKRFNNPLRALWNKGVRVACSTQALTVCL